MPCLPLSRIAPRRRLMAMTGVLALAVTTAAEASKPPRPPEPEMFDLDPVLRSEVRVTEDFRAKPASGGLFKLLKAGDRLVIHKGVFTPSMGLRADGREWLLIPYVLRSQGQARSPNSSMSPVSGCFSRFTRLLALDRQTLQVEPWVWKIHDQGRRVERADRHRDRRLPDHRLHEPCRSRGSPTGRRSTPVRGCAPARDARAGDAAEEARDRGKALPAPRLVPVHGIHRGRKPRQRQGPDPRLGRRVCRSGRSPAEELH
jgi:hypothetical protein